jgi:maltooligosyltrehalose trehalohydrolase
MEIDLEPRATGIFEQTVPEAAPGTDYFYRLDGRREVPDPVSRYQPAGVHGPSQVIDPQQYRWSQVVWNSIEPNELVIYEVHVGTFTEAGTFEAAIPYLPELRDLGVTALQLMPVAEFPGERNWGYDGVFPYAPHSRYGGPRGLRQLVDAAHRLDLAVILDVVYNHLGPEGNVLAELGPYFTDRHQTPWGPAVNLDGPGSAEVRRYFRENALYWIQEYRLDGLRLDAVHAMYDLSETHFLAELAESVRGLGDKLGRRVHLIAESELNDPRLVRGREEGGYGLDAVWSDDFHHAVHAALTGERQSYYVDFGGVRPLAKALSERFVYDGTHSRFRGGRHGAPARDLPTDRFVHASTFAWRRPCCSSLPTCRFSLWVRSTERRTRFSTS